MIDEKKIQEAAIMNADYFNPCRSTLDREEACRASFEDGVEWFKKALWHEASVKPEGNAVILYQWLDDRGTMDVEWAKFVEYDRIDKWCYIEDLLPKRCKK